MTFLSKLRAKLTYANVMSTLAVCLTLGGGAAVAATTLGRGSVESKNIAKGAVKTRQLGADAATGNKVDEESLGTVPSAVTASTADTATSASRAGDAETVGGKSASRLSTASGFVQDANDVTLGGTDQPIASTTITTPGPSRLLATATVGVQGTAGERAECHLEIDGEPSPQYEVTLEGTGIPDERLSIQYARNNMLAGAHAVVAQCQDVSGSGTVAKDDATISVIAVPVP